MNLEKIKIAHRGCHDDKIPENSMGAFKKCLEHNFAIELDVHILKDKKVIVFHDDNLKRMTGDTRNVIDLTYKEMSKLRLNKTNEKIPLLTDVLKTVNGKVLLDIELKYDHENFELEDELIKILKDYKGEFILKSFSYKTVRYLKKNTDYTVGLLYPNINNPKYELKEYQKWLIRHVNFNMILKPDFIACSKKALDDRCIKKFKGPKLLWTIKNEEEFNNYKNKVDGLIGDFL